MDHSIQNICIEGIDAGEVARRYSGSMEDYFELLDLYCLDGRRKIIVLQELWEKHDYKNYGIEVHGLKSASANVGAMYVSDSALEHENAVNRGDTAFVDTNISQLLAVYEAQLAHISQFLEGSRKADDGKEKTRVLDHADFVEGIRQALASLENFRAKDCAHKIEEILQCRLDPGMEERLTEIWQQLRLYEDEAAERLLRELLECV